MDSDAQMGILTFPYSIIEWLIADTIFKGFKCTELWTFWKLNENSPNLFTDEQYSAVVQVVAYDFLEMNYALNNISFY